MPTQSNTNNASQGGSPFEIISPSKSKSGGRRGLIIGTLIVVFLLLSIVAGVLLVRQRQNVQEKAAAALCPAAEECPAASQPTLLRNCHPPESDGSPQESICNVTGRMETCGSATYCCPGPNQTWTTDLTKCPTPTPSATPTPTATATATPTPTATAGTTQATIILPTATPVPTLSTTSAPSATAQAIPVTGTGWPTYVGAGVGIIVIIASILIAL